MSSSALLIKDFSQGGYRLWEKELLQWTQHLVKSLSTYEALGPTVKVIKWSSTFSRHVVIKKNTFPSPIPLMHYINMSFYHSMHTLIPPLSSPPSLQM